MKCPSCGYNNPDDAPYCSMCQISFIKPILEPTGTVYKPEYAESPTSTTACKPDEYNWFQRHLNWTFMLPLIFIFSFGILLAMLRINAGDATGIIEFFAVAVSITMIILGAWVLYRKNRSFAWLALMLLSGLGLIIFLCLSNHEDERPLSKRKTPQRSLSSQPY